MNTYFENPCLNRTDHIFFRSQSRFSGQKPLPEITILTFGNPKQNQMFTLGSFELCHNLSFWAFIWFFFKIKFFWILIDLRDLNFCLWALYRTNRIFKFFYFGSSTTCVQNWPILYNTVSRKPINAHLLWKYHFDKVRFFRFSAN